MGRASGDRTCWRAVGEKLARAPSVCVCGGEVSGGGPDRPGALPLCRLAPSRYSDDWQGREAEEPRAHMNSVSTDRRGVGVE